MVAGMRVELPHKNAIKLELGRMQPVAGAWHSSFSLQWSAAIP
jgi:hypothetical protein